MVFMVKDGEESKIFTDYDEAKAYEDKLLEEKALGVSKIRVRDCFMYLRTYGMCRFRKVVKLGKEYYVVILANNNTFSKAYIDAVIEHIFGSRYSFDNANNLHENYKVFSSFKDGLDDVSSVEEISYKVADAKHFTKLKNIYNNDNLYIFVQNDNFLKSLISRGDIVVNNEDIDSFFNMLFNI